MGNSPVLCVKKSFICFTAESLRRTEPSRKVEPQTHPDKSTTNVGGRAVKELAEINKKLGKILFLQDKITEIAKEVKDSNNINIIMN